MKISTKILVGVLALLGAFYVGVTLYLSFFIDACSNYVLAELHSPSREHKAVVELRSCTDGEYEEFELWVLPAESPEQRHGAPLVINPATTEVYLEWRASNELVVRHPAALEIENRSISLAGIQISFETMGKMD